MIPAATTPNRTALVPTNPRVKSIAFRLRWHVDTVIQRVEDALPSPVEQQLYLAVAGGFRIHPESLRKLLDVFLDGDNLRESDLQQVTIGPHLVVSRFDQTVDKIQSALSLLDKTSDTMAASCLSMTVVARLVEVYGDSAEEIVGSVIENSEYVADRLHLHQSTSTSAVIGIALADLCKRLALGREVPMTVEEMFR